MDLYTQKRRIPAWCLRILFAIETIAEIPVSASGLELRGLDRFPFMVTLCWDFVMYWMCQLSLKNGESQASMLVYPCWYIHWNVCYHPFRIISNILIEGYGTTWLFILRKFRFHRVLKQTTIGEMAPDILKTWVSVKTGLEPGRALKHSKPIMRIVHRLGYSLYGVWYVWRNGRLA